MKNLIRKAFLKSGFLISKIPESADSIHNIDEYVSHHNRQKLSFSSIDNFRKAYPVVKANTMVPYEVLAALFEQVRLIEEASIEGDFVECGVWKGGSVGTMALSNLTYGRSRRVLHLFDAFEDICPPDPEVDGERAIQETLKYSKLKPSEIKKDLVPMEGFYDFLGGHGTVKDCYQLLIDKIGYHKEDIRIYQGWFQDTFPVHSNKIEKIAVLRLDSDWYESTKLSLEHFYDKVQQGGIIIIDDYGTYEGCRKATDEFLKTRGIKKHLLNSYSLNGECYFMIK